jgi:hypothetical protein
MTKVAKAKSSKKSSKTQNNYTLPGKADSSMNDDSLKKAYSTFVSLEIDKAKMRVGRSNFDKIYMEAVKYIDKKYGFKVLSDSEKFKEYLNQYYISAFDIKTFDEWIEQNGRIHSVKVPNGKFVYFVVVSVVCCDHESSKPSNLYI